MDWLALELKTLEKARASMVGVLLGVYDGSSFRAIRFHLCLMSPKEEKSSRGKNILDRMAFFHTFAEFFLP